MIESGNHHSKDRAKPLVLNTFTLNVDPDDTSLAGHLHSQGFWESWITAWMTNVIQPDWNCLDIGANFGYYTGVFKSLTSGRIAAFEPNPLIAEMLRRSIVDNEWENVELHELALGEEKSNLVLSLSKKYQGSASLFHNEEYFKSWDKDTITYNVNVDTLDGVAGNERWDFIKIDVEGWEPQVWAGGQKVLESASIIAVEISPDHPADFLDMLFREYHVTDIGYDGYELPVIRETIQTRDWWMLALRKRENG